MRGGNWREVGGVGEGTGGVRIHGKLHVAHCEGASSAALRAETD